MVESPQPYNPAGTPGARDTNAGDEVVEATTALGGDPAPVDSRSIMALARELPHLALIETAGALPGLLPATAWQAIRQAQVVVATDPASHPAVPGLMAVAVTVEPLAPANPEPLLGRNLLAAPATARGDLARGLLDLARSHRDVAFLLDPDDSEFGREVGLAAARDADVEVEYVFLVGAPEGLALLDLVAVMDRLLDPADGCPWDLEQTHESLSPHMVEETYETLDAIAAGDDDAIAEELGDVLLQVVFHARIARGRGAFDIDRVAAGIAEKLRRRHPHVFGEVEVADADEVKRNWDAIKADEKPERESAFDGIPRAMPSLPLVHKVLARAGRLGWRPDGPAATTMIAAAVAELTSLVDGPVEDSPDVPDGDDVAEAIDEAIGEVVVALALLAGARGRDTDALVRRRVGILMDRFEAAARRAATRGIQPTTSDQWQTLLDDVAAAGW